MFSIKEKANRFDKIVDLYNNINDNNILDTLEKIGDVINNTFVDKNIVKKVNKSYNYEFKYPFSEDTNIKEQYTKLFGKSSYGLVDCFRCIFQKYIEIGIFKSGDILPPPEVLSNYLKTSTKQYPRKIRIAYDFLTENHHRLTDGVIFSQKLLTKRTDDIYIVD